MATASNRLAVTQAPIYRSSRSDQRDNANTPHCELNIDVESGYRVRKEGELSKVEQLCIHDLDVNPTTNMPIKLDFATLLEGPRKQLKKWPYFFCSKKESGIALQTGFVTLWSNFMIAETLLAALSIQPLVTVPDVAHRWQSNLYGYTWMITMICNMWSIAITAFFLGFILGCPNKVAWKWMCEIGWLRSIPGILLILVTVMTFVAIACSCWILYGYQMGIVCVVVEFFVIIITFKLVDVLEKVQDKVIQTSLDWGNNV